MNIFFLDRDPKLCAEYHCNKHVVKMIVESSQMLGSAYYVSNGITSKKQINQKFISKVFSNFPRQLNGVPHPYGIGYVNHPCTIWTRSCWENWNWLLDLANNLCNEYTDRYNKIHACSKILTWMESNVPTLKELGDISTPALAMPDDCKTSDPVESYRSYYKKYKLGFAKWPENKIPDWI